MKLVIYLMLVFPPAVVSAQWTTSQIHQQNKDSILSVMSFKLHISRSALDSAFSVIATYSSKIREIGRIKTMSNEAKLEKMRGVAQERDSLLARIMPSKQLQQFRTYVTHKNLDPDDRLKSEL